MAELQELPENAQIAVIDERVRNLEIKIEEKFDSLTNLVKDFILTNEKKLDLNVYLDDRGALSKELREIEERIRILEDSKLILDANSQGKQTERNKIWGVSNGTLQTIISLLTLITLIAAISGIL